MVSGARWLPLVALVGATIARPAGAAQQVQVTGLVDLPLGFWMVNMPDATAGENVCVYVAVAPRDYYVVATSSNATGGQFRMRSASGHYLAYHVGWADAPNRTFATSTAAGAGLPFAGSGVQSVLQH